MTYRLSKFSKWLLTGLMFLAAQPAIADEWEWTVAPYLWASSVGLDMTINDNTTIGGEAEFLDLVDKLDGVFMGHFEGMRGPWGMYLDLIYLKLADTNTVAVGPGGPILGDLMTDTTLKMKIYDAGGIYRVTDQNATTHFDLLAGLRYIDVSVDALITLPGPQANEIDIQTGPSETDLMIGGRLTGNFTERWHWGLRADYSFLGTEGTFNGIAAFGYTFGETGLFSLDLGYRYMSIKMDGMTPQGGTTESKVKMTGPLLGFIFKF